MKLNKKNLSTFFSKSWSITRKENNKNCVQFLPNVLVARRRNISTLDLRWTMRCVMDVYFRRKSFSEAVDESSVSVTLFMWAYFLGCFQQEIKREIMSSRMNCYFKTWIYIHTHVCMYTRAGNVWRLTDRTLLPTLYQWWQSRKINHLVTASAVGNGARHEALPSHQCRPKHRRGN